MIAGIMTMLEFGLSLTAQQGQMGALAPVPMNPSVLSVEKDLMTLLHTQKDLKAIQAGMGATNGQTTFCGQLLCRASVGDQSKCGYNVDKTEEGSSKRVDKNQNVYNFLGGYRQMGPSCVVEKTIAADGGKHRIYVEPDSVDPLVPPAMFSCYPYDNEDPKYVSCDPG